MVPPMRPLLALTVIALATSALAGCIGKDDTTPVTPGSVVNVPSLDELPTKTPLEVSLSQDLYWVAPGTPVTFTASSPAAAGKPLSYAWQYGPPLPAHLRPQKEGEAAAADDGHQHMVRLPDTTAPASPGHDGGEDHEESAGEGEAGEGGHNHAASGLDTGNIDPGADGHLTFEEEGIYFFHCHPHPWMKLKITVQEGAETPEEPTVFIVDGDSQESFRYYPDELTVAPGTTVHFENNGSAPHTVTEEGRTGLLKSIPGTGPEVTFDFPEAGEFRVVVTVTDGADGEGVTEAMILVDENVPADTFRQTYTDDFQFSDPAGAAKDAGFVTSANHPFKIDHDGDLTATLQVTSDTPVPPAVTVYLYREGESSPLQTLENTDAGTITAPVTAGTYRIVVEPMQGASFTSQVDLVVNMLLKPSASGGGDGHGGHQH